MSIKGSSKDWYKKAEITLVMSIVIVVVLSSVSLDSGGTSAGINVFSQQMQREQALFPPDIEYEVPITISNVQATGTGVNFQQKLVIDSLEFYHYEASNLQNVEFFYQNGTIIPSWLESGNANNSAATIYWLKVANGVSAESSTTVFMGFSSLVTNLFNAINVGEAPQLSPIYGEYDDGANVFLAYFNGNTPLSDFSTMPGVSVTHDTRVAYSSTAINTIHIGNYPSDWSPGLAFNRAFPNEPVVVEGNVQSYTANGDQSHAAIIDSANAASISNGVGVDMGWGNTYFCNDYMSSDSMDGGLNSQGTATTSWTYGTVTYYGPSSNQWNGFISPQLYNSNGGFSGSVNNNPLSSARNLYLGILGETNSYFPWDLNINYIRARAYPPNDVMPTVSFGSVVLTGQNLYNVVFTESGLSAGSTFYISIDNTTLESHYNKITLTLPNGTYRYVAKAFSRLGTASGNISGTLNIEGNNENVRLHFGSPISPYFSIFSVSVLIPLLWILVFAAGTVLERRITR